MERKLDFFRHCGNALTELSEAVKIFLELWSNGETRLRKDEVKQVEDMCKLLYEAERVIGKINQDFERITDKEEGTGGTE